MHDAAAVRFVEGVGDLAAKFYDLIERKRAFLQPLRQRLAFHAFHDQIVDAVLMADVVEYADVWMIQAGNCFGFALEALLAKRIIRKLRRPDLERHGAFPARIPRAIHLAHAASAQRSNDLIRTKPAPGG